jgi:hypothetical protein
MDWYQMTSKSILRKIFISFARAKLSEIQNFKNIHKNESCYLIGDGVSLKYFDLKNFSDKISIPCGLLPFHNDFELLNSPYLLLIEPWWFYPYIRTTSGSKKIVKNKIQASYRKIIEKYPQKKFFINISNIYSFVGVKNITYVYRDLIDNDLEESFIANRIEAFHGSLRASITIALYMGFTDIHLIGYDYTHFPSRSLHWYERGSGLICNQPAYNADFFEIAKEFANITTITLDGESEFLNSMKYEKYTGESPIFKENTEILNANHLAILSSWPGYSIY